MNQASTNFEEAVTNNTEPVKVQPAGFFIRLAAYLVDYLIAGGIIAMIKVPLWFVKLLVPDSIVFKNILFGYDIFDIANFCLLRSACVPDNTAGVHPHRRRPAADARLHS